MKRIVFTVLMIIAICVVPGLGVHGGLAGKGEQRTGGEFHFKGIPQSADACNETHQAA